MVAGAAEVAGVEEEVVRRGRLLERSGGKGGVRRRVVVGAVRSRWMSEAEGNRESRKMLWRRGRGSNTVRG